MAFFPNPTEQSANARRFVAQLLDWALQQESIGFMIFSERGCEGHDWVNFSGDLRVESTKSRFDTKTEKSGSIRSTHLFLQQSRFPRTRLQIPGFLSHLANGTRGRRWVAPRRDILGPTEGKSSSSFVGLPEGSAAVRDMNREFVIVSSKSRVVVNLIRDFMALDEIYSV
ncbi:DNAJ heat shock N-terminal domain-containing protein [Striga asiatica]|uniref:DNAJ heat shock N-terminal domain-containing protein n=1 Tax=Striga asiatica TaxID=4170 RepID=A0A5A7R5F6_STRAF|nr:DNAJ heat shock N-terminal domain-containing protein [Striga asiatica]